MSAARRKGQASIWSHSVPAVAEQCRSHSRSHKTQRQERPSKRLVTERILDNARALSGAGKRTAASGVAWSGCASLRGPLCAGEALLEARTQASVAFFKLGAHSATLRPEFGGPKSLRCCCAKGVGHRAQLMLRARRGDRENNHPVPLLRTPTPQNALSLLSSLRGVTTTKSLD